MSKKIAALAIALALEDDDPVIRKKRSCQSREWLLKRSRFTHQNLMIELGITSPAEFKQFMRMDIDTFHELLEMVSPLIKKQVITI